MDKKMIATPNAPAAIGPYAQAVQMGDFLYTSGQLGIDVTVGKLADGVENQVAIALLPEGIDEGDKLIWENFEYRFA